MTRVCLTIFCPYLKYGKKIIIRSVWVGTDNQTDLVGKNPTPATRKKSNVDKLVRQDINLRQFLLIKTFKK